MLRLPFPLRSLVVLSHYRSLWNSLCCMYISSIVHRHSDSCSTEVISSWEEIAYRNRERVLSFSRASPSVSAVYDFL